MYHTTVTCITSGTNIDPHPGFLASTLEILFRPYPSPSVASGSSKPVTVALGSGEGQEGNDLFTGVLTLPTIVGSALTNVVSVY